jgi:hypothetical protein
VTAAAIETGTVRLRRLPPLEPPYDDEAAPRLRLLPPHVEDLLPFEETGPLPDATFDRRPTPRAELPDPKPWAARLILATLEALCGRRPVQQLMPWTDDAVYAQIARAVKRHRAATRPGVLRSLHVSEPADGVAEICAVIGNGERSRAVAARLEGADGRWRCTTLRVM